MFDGHLQLWILRRRNLFLEGLLVVLVILHHVSDVFLIEIRARKTLQLIQLRLVVRLKPVGGGTPSLSANGFKSLFNAV